jgi:hypothetical protein
LAIGSIVKMCGSSFDGERTEDLAELKASHEAFVNSYSKVRKGVQGKRLMQATVHAHCRRGLRLLRKEYDHASVVSKPPARKAWLRDASQELGVYERTFDRKWAPSFLSGRALTVLPGLEILLTVIGLSGLSGVGALISGNCLCEVFRFVPPIAGGAILMFGAATFDDTRKLFVHENLYRTEDAVYGALGAVKRREPSLWAVAFAFISAIWLATALLEALAIGNHVIVSENQRAHWAIFGVFALITIVIFVATRKRDPA